MTLSPRMMDLQQNESFGELYSNSDQLTALRYLSPQMDGFKTFDHRTYNPCLDSITVRSLNTQRKMKPLSMSLKNETLKEFGLT